MRLTGCAIRFSAGNRRQGLRRTGLACCLASFRAEGIKGKFKMTTAKKTRFIRGLLDTDQVTPQFPLALNGSWELNPKYCGNAGLDRISEQRKPGKKKETREP